MDFLSKDQARIEFERFVTGDGDDLLRTAYVITSDLPEAEDLTQECLLRVARRWSKVRAMDRPAAYARRVLINLALDNGRHRTRRWQELLRLDGLSEARLALHGNDRIDHGVDRQDTHGDLLDAVRALPTRQRVILVLRYFGDFSEAQVAEMLGCSVGTVKSTTSRSLVRLREALQPSTTAHTPQPVGAGDQLRSRSR